MILKGRKVMGGIVRGEALVSKEPVSFYGGIDPTTGCVTEPGHCCCGEKISGKVFTFPSGKGSTVGSYVIYRMKKLGTAPLAIINQETEAIIATGCVISDIPLIDKFDKDPIEVIKTGMLLKVNGNDGVVEVIEKKDNSRN
jgi:predicted aconitase with swiveling domain